MYRLYIHSANSVCWMCMAAKLHGGSGVMPTPNVSLIRLLHNNARIVGLSQMHGLIVLGTWFPHSIRALYSMCPACNCLLHRLSCEKAGLQAWLRVKWSHDPYWRDSTLAVYAYRINPLGDQSWCRVDNHLARASHIKDKITTTLKS